MVAERGLSGRTVREEVGGRVEGPLAVIEPGDVGAVRPVRLRGLGDVVLDPATLPEADERRARSAKILALSRDRFVRSDAERPPETIPRGLVDLWLPRSANVRAASRDRLARSDAALRPAAFERELALLWLPRSANVRASSRARTARVVAPDDSRAPKRRSVAGNLSVLTGRSLFTGPRAAMPKRRPPCPSVLWRWSRSDRKALAPRWSARRWSPADRTDRRPPAELERASPKRAPKAK